LVTRAKKEEIVESLTSEFAEAGAIVACNYTGLSVQELEELRKSAREKGVKVQVVKNTLAKLAFERNGFEVLNLSGMNIFLWSEDTINAPKVAYNFAKDNKKLEIKAGYLSKEIADIAKIEAFAKLPGREELLGMLAAVWMAPIRNFTIGLNALKEKKEEENS
jgi:large subunit ribosomal protein L10